MTSRASHRPPHRSTASRALSMSLLVVAASHAIAALAPVGAQAMDTGRGGQSVESYLGVSSTGISRLQRRSEELIAACMKGEGFEYTPQTDTIPQGAIDSLTGNRKEFVAKYGYGISTFVEPPKKGVRSPNEAYVAKLSKADKRAYNIALLGFDPDKPGAAAGVGAGLSDKSCVGKAQRELFGDMAKLIALGSKFEDLAKRLNGDPKVVRAVREWSACMKKGGYTYAKEDDVASDLSAKLNKVVGGSTGPLGLGGSSSAATVDTPGLRRLQKEELSIAKVDWDCSVKHLGPRDELAKQLNKEFIAQNKGALDSLRKVLGG